MIIDRTHPSDSHLSRMFEGQDWNPTLAAREWLRENKELRNHLAMLLREILGASRPLVTTNPVVHEWRKRMHQRNKEALGTPLRPNFDALMDAAHAAALAGRYAEQDAYFKFRPNIPCGLADHYVEQFETNRRLAQLYLAAALTL